MTSGGLTVLRWNMRYFFTILHQLKAVVNGCDIFCLSEHGLFDEQKYLFETFSDQFVENAVCSDDNPDIMDGKRAHWRR